jgi:hypothetical protein
MKTQQPCESRARRPATAGRLLSAFGLLGLIVALSRSLSAQTNLLMLDYQWADSVTGPWTKPPASQTYVQPNGSLLTLATNPQKYFRLTIQQIDFEDIQTPAVQVAHLGPETITIAESHLQWMANFFQTAGDDTNGQPWASARLAPVAFKVFDPAYRNGTEPAYVEFKIVSDFQPAEKPAEFLVGNEAAPVCDLGHILVSLHEGDAPVPEFNDEGRTPCEELLKRVGSLPNIKIVRFGPTFTTAENERGELLANAGTDPFRLPDDLFRYDQTFKGEFDSETAAEPPTNGYGGPALRLAHYRSYAEFKTDYVDSPIYQEFRRRKARAVAPEWVIIQGGRLTPPSVISIRVGQWLHAFESQTVTRYFLDDDEAQAAPLATIDPNTGGDGLAIRGNRLGSARFTVEIGGRVTHYELQVVATGTPAAGGAEFAAAAAGFTPGWQNPQQWVTPGGYDATPRYKQTKDYNLWCSKVGCGPVAWAMLFGHWDRTRNVPATFYWHIPGDLSQSDAPYTVEEAPARMHAVYALLHDYCDVICSPSGAGATPPGDMIEAGATYLWLPRTLGYLGYTYSWAWDLSDPDWNEPSNRIRTSIKNGRPAIIGLGWLWHYGVAYAYRYQEFKASPDVVLFRRRWFKCNEGWGHANGAWYSGADTFLGASINAWQK